MKLFEKAWVVVEAIEECGASDKLTQAVTLAGDLATELEFHYWFNKAVLKGWDYPALDYSGPKHPWSWYWKLCEIAEQTGDWPEFPK